jgi:hypothetical protein
LPVLGPAELAQIDQPVRHQLHPLVPLLEPCKSEQQALALIFPRASPFDTHPQGLASCIAAPLPATLRGFAMTRMRVDVRNQTRVENARAIAGRVKAAIEVEGSASEVQADLLGYALPRL